MRTILHSDLNAFYANVECLYEPSLRLVPLAVTGDPDARHGIILTKNQMAKNFGVKTGEPIWQARAKCPSLVTVTANMDRYIRFSGLMRGIYADFTDRIEPFGMDECWLDVSGNDGTTVANEIRRRAKKELGLTVSIGVADNKIFAKLGSDMKKPDATTVITRENYKEKVWPLPVGDLLYVGPATLGKLIARNIQTIGQLANTDSFLLRDMLGVQGDTLHRFANGQDRTPVAREEGRVPLAQSVGNSTTASRDILDNEDAKWVFMMLSEIIGQRMREHGFTGREVQIWVRDSEMFFFEKRMNLAKSTDLESEILDAAMKLFCESYGWPRPVRSLGLRVGKLKYAGDPEQLSLFDDPKREKLRCIDQTVDGLRRRFGDNCVRRGFLFQADKQNLSDPINKMYKPFECVRQG